MGSVVLCSRILLLILVLDNSFASLPVLNNSLLSFSSLIENKAIPFPGQML